MKIKNLLFASAAGLMTISATQAADLPTAEPVEYMRVCDAFGTGFFYIPGTDTCLQISGYARYEAHYVDVDPDLGDQFNNFTTRTRGQVNFDARTMTDLGLLRSYIALRGTIGPADTGGYSDGFNIDKAWLSLANDSGTLTAGHHGSFFDFFGGNAMNTRIGGDDPTLSTNLLAYTFAIGNGVSASISVEDKWFRRYGSVYFTTNTAGSITTVGTDLPDGQELPDFVANIRIDQGWGSAQVMGAVGEISNSAPALPAASDTEIGWAAGAGLSVGVPGTGISFDMQGAYAEGLVAYVTTGNGTHIFDAVIEFPGALARDLELTRAWSVQAGLSADISPTVSVGLDGAYARVDHRGTFDFLGDFADYDTFIVAGTAHWTPVPGLTISGEVSYENIDHEVGGFPVTPTTAVLSDTDVWGAMMRINRTF